MFEVTLYVPALYNSNPEFCLKGKCKISPVKFTEKVAFMSKHSVIITFFLTLGTDDSNFITAASMTFKLRIY